MVNMFQNLDNIPAVKWGREHEETAKQAFMTSECCKHRKFNIKSVGLLILEPHPYILSVLMVL